MTNPGLATGAALRPRPVPRGSRSGPSRLRAGRSRTHLRRSRTSCSTLFKRARSSCGPRLGTEADDA